MAAIGGLFGDQHWKKPVHIVSSTSIHPDGDKSARHYLSLCGKDLGPWEKAASGNKVGNYLADSLLHLITCFACKKARLNRS